MEAKTAGLRGRQAQAARNDQAILDAARAVFIRDPAAPISAVADEAGVGVGALYRRYASKEELLRRLCTDGLRRFIAIAESALARSDPWEAFATFVSGVVESDVHSLTVHLAGTFTPTADLHDLAAHAGALAGQVFQQAQAAQVLRPGLDANDLPMVFEQLAAIRLGDPARVSQLRRRYLTLLLDAMRAGATATPLPWPPPSAAELSARWQSPQPGHPDTG